MLSPPPATPETYTLSLHDALPISRPPGDTRAAAPGARGSRAAPPPTAAAPRPRAPPHRTPPRATAPASAPSRRTGTAARSEEHTSELQSRRDLVCRLLLEKKKRSY